MRDLSLPDERTYCIRYETGRPRFSAVLAFSPTQVHLLAVANGSQILIFDVAARKTRITLKGNGRIVNSIVFAISEPNTLVTGAVDGSFCVWSLDEPSRPLHHVRGLIGACSNVTISPSNVNHLAVCHKGKVSIWSLPGLRPVAVMHSMTPALELLSWCPAVPNSIAGVSSSGTITIWDAQDALSSTQTTAKSELPEDDEEDDHAMFGEPDDVNSAPCCTFELGYPVAQVQLLGRCGLVVLPRYGKTLYFYAYSQELGEMTELWRLSLDASIDCFTLRDLGTNVKAVACFYASIQDHNVPAPVLDGMGWSQTTSSTIRSPRVQAHGSPKTRVSSRSGATMRPEAPLSRDRIERKAIVAPSRPLPVDIARRERFDYHPSRIIHNRKPRSEASPAPSVKSKLGLPANNDTVKETEATMPFLSPTIPARQIAHDTMPPLDLHLPSTTRASFDSMVSSTTLENDSDSDDETFAGNMRSSGLLLPGGVNVPLPRTCGASFGPNGQLCTFFPLKARPPSFLEEVEVMDSGKVGAHISDATRLFPTFGNLAASLRLNDDSGLNSEVELSDLASDAPQFIVQPASFESRPSWKAKVSPIKATARPLVDEHTVNVTVREMGSLLPGRKSLAEQYQLVSQTGESDAKLCNDNADVAAGEGLCEVSDAWHALAMILEPVPLVDNQFPGDWIHDLGTTSQRPALSRNISTVSECISEMKQSGVPHLQWNHPLGQAWAVDKIIGWAEQRADVQTLACTSALTTRAAERQVTDYLRQVSVVQPDVLASRLLELDANKIRHGIPALYRQSSGLEMVEETPPKPHISRTSSRDPSQPPTPHLNSSTSTPPLSFSAANRQNARFFASGSASPEQHHHHRSSFGAAAKYYAQTISDKFSSYGSSPPTRKAGTSPGNELSSSLPTAPGSWSKSVSFVSNLASARNDARRMSLAQEDDTYDSDKTIDDASLPRTPKISSTGVSYTTNGQDAFFDELGTNPSDALYPAQMAGRGRLWCQSYSEQLRSWDLLVEAAELDNINNVGAAPDCSNESGLATISPEPVTGKARTMCAICYCIIRGAEQLCPSCLHTTHPSCLEQLIEGQHGENFTCPTGCGCNCSHVADFAFVAVESTQTAVETVPPPFKKKSSFTDPRRLRVKLQGESW